MLDYYDVVYESCNISKNTEQMLGYKKIFIANKEIKVIDESSKNKDVQNSITFNSSRTNVLSLLNMSPSAVVFPDSRINKKAMEQMLDKSILLCLPISIITNSSHLQRSRNLYMMSKLFDHARSIKLDVSFVTLAKTSSSMCSYMQLIEVAKLVGATEEYARKSISEINRSLLIK